MIGFRHVLLLSILTYCPFLSAGPGGTGGGDSLLCNGRYFSYDYQITDDGGAKLNPEFVKAKSAMDILRSIAKTMKTKIPELSRGLNDFIGSLGNTNRADPNAKRIWIDGVNPLGRVPDESRLRIPKDCKDRSGKLQIFQTVVRIEHPRTEYNVNRGLLALLERNSALQLSFLYVHEWLRDYTDNTTVIAQVDRLLHETEWLSDSGEDLKRVLVGSGLDAVRGMSTLNKELAAGATYTYVQIDQLLGAILVKDMMVGRSHLRSFMYCPQWKLEEGGVDEAQCSQIGKAKAYLFDQFQMAIDQEKERIINARTSLKAELYTSMGLMVTGGVMWHGGEIGKITGPGIFRVAGLFRRFDVLVSRLLPTLRLSPTASIPLKYVVAGALIAQGLFVAADVLSTAYRAPKGRLKAINFLSFKNLKEGAVYPWHGGEVLTILEDALNDLVDHQRITPVNY